MTIGLFLSIWLAIGFIVSVKLIFVDKFTESEEVLDMIENATTAPEQFAARLLSDKRTVMAIFTLMGPVAFVLDTIDMYRETKWQVKNYIRRFKNKK